MTTPAKDISLSRRAPSRRCSDGPAAMTSAVSPSISGVLRSARTLFPARIRKRLRSAFCGPMTRTFSRVSALISAARRVPSQPACDCAPASLGSCVIPLPQELPLGDEGHAATKPLECFPLELLLKAWSIVSRGHLSREFIVSLQHFLHLSLHSQSPLRASWICVLDAHEMEQLYRALPSELQRNRHMITKCAVTSQFARGFACSQLRRPTVTI